MIDDAQERVHRSKDRGTVGHCWTSTQTESEIRMMGITARSRTQDKR